METHFLKEESLRGSNPLRQREFYEFSLAEDIHVYI